MRPVRRTPKPIPSLNTEHTGRFRINLQRDVVREYTLAAGLAANGTEEWLTYPLVVLM